MGRPRKLKPGDVAWFLREGEDENGEPTEYRQYSVVVDYYRKDMPSEAGYYIVIPTTSQHTQMVVTGSSMWVKSNHLHKVDTGYKMRTILTRYRRNDALGKKQERGCHCHCCIHTAVPSKHVNVDGQFSWDLEEGEEE